jgi:hypothetical protein
MIGRASALPGPPALCTRLPAIVVLTRPATSVAAPLLALLGFRLGGDHWPLALRHGLA